MIYRLGEMKKVVVLCKARLESLPPVMTVADVLCQLGYDVTVICSESTASTKADYKARGIAIFDVCPGHGTGTMLAKASFWRRFHAEAWKALDRLENIDLLWVGSVDGALALGRRLLQRRFVLHALELYDKDWIYRRLMKIYVKNAAAVVISEACRAAIFRAWYGLNKTPFVLPNKPACHPRNLRLAVEDVNARNLLSSLGSNDKIVLYQGGIYPARQLDYVADAVQSMGDDWRFLVMGPAHADYLAALKKCNARLIHIPNIIAPKHLQITSHAYIGILSYSHVSLNNVFCAPNKIWEYSGFGLPMLCNDLPPLQMSVGATGAGLCIDIEDSREIATALKKIDNHYESFSQNSLKLFDSVDVHKIVERVIERACL